MDPTARPAAPTSPEIEELRRQLQQLQGVLPERVDVNPDGVEQGLAKLVLTLIELLRQLLERQAVRRMDGGSLTDEEIERMGVALMRLDEKMAELSEQFGLRRDDLNLDLGPLGKLL